MQGGMPPYRRRVRMQLRASNTLAPLGRTYWSDPVQLDSLGGAAVVSVPLPTAGPASVITDDRSAYMLSVTANQVSRWHQKAFALQTSMWLDVESCGI